MTQRIAIIDDEADILELVSVSLKRSGFDTREFMDANSFFAYYRSHPLPDFLILDLMLPQTDGYEVCRILRKDPIFSAMPIMMLTAKADEIDKVVGLELGADDYMTKPFSPKELVARVKAILRRSAMSATTQSNTEKSIIQLENILTINSDRFEVIVSGQKIELTTTEFKILELLCRNIGIVYSRDKILDYLWGNEKAVIGRTIDVHIKNLRDKIGSAGKYIKNIRGLGYKIEL